MHDGVGTNESEAQRLEERYSPSVYQGASLFTGAEDEDIDRIQQRCQEFENLSFSAIEGHGMCGRVPQVLLECTVGVESAVAIVAIEGHGV